MLANHIWSVAGDSDRRDISTTFLQPFASYTTPTAWTATLQTESTYDWEESEWQVPLRAIVSRIVRIGILPVSLAGGVTYWAEAPDNGPEGWGYRFTMTFLFPR